MCLCEGRSHIYVYTHTCVYEYDMIMWKKILTKGRLYGECNILTLDTFDLYNIWGSKSLRPILYEIMVSKGLIIFNKGVIS